MPTEQNTPPIEETARPIAAAIEAEIDLDDEHCNLCKAPTTRTDPMDEHTQLCNYCAQDAAAMVPGLLARIDALTAEIKKLQDAKVFIDGYGAQLFTALGDFLRRLAKEGGPLTTSILCRMPDGSEQPLIWLWATTDGQHPIARMSQLREELENQKGINAQLRRQLAADFDRKL
jgi:hypothetical protein